MKRGFIAIEGIPGSGKEKLVRYLAEQRGARKLLEKSENNPFLKHFLKDRERYAFSTQMSFLTSRYQNLHDLKGRDLFHDLILSDFTWQRNFIYANLLLSSKELELFKNIVAQFSKTLPVPEKIIYLQAEQHNLRKPHGLDIDTSANLIKAYDHFFFHYDDSPLVILRLDHFNFNDVNDLKAIDNFLDNEIKGTVYLTRGGGLFK